MSICYCVMIAYCQAEQVKIESVHNTQRIVNIAPQYSRK